MKGWFKDLKLVDVAALMVFGASVLLAYFFLLRRAEYINVILRVSQSDLINSETGGISATLPAWYLEKIRVDDFDSLKKSDISIVKTLEYQNNSNEKIMYVTLKLATVFDKKTGGYTYGGIPLLVGSYQNFRYKNVMLRGIIQEVNWLGQEREEKVLEVEARADVGDYLAKKIVKGLTINDSNDRELVKIEAVSLGNGSKKGNLEVKLKMKVVVEKFGDVFLYGGEKTIKIGEETKFDFWDFNFNGIITSIKEVEKDTN